MCLSAFYVLASKQLLSIYIISISPRCKPHVAMVTTIFNWLSLLPWFYVVLECYINFTLEASCVIIIHDISIGFIKSMFHNTNKTRMCLWSINLRETAFQQKYIDPNWFVIDIFQQRREIASKGIVKRLKSWDIFLYNNSSLALITSSFIINKFIIVFIVGSIKVKFLSSRKMYYIISYPFLWVYHVRHEILLSNYMVQTCKTILRGIQCIHVVCNESINIWRYIELKDL